MKHGDSCESKLTEYSFQISNGTAICENRANTCERALCECDVEFAREHFLQIKVFDDKYRHHRNPRPSQWDPASADFICPHGEASVYVPKCCAPEDGTGVARLYNAASKACCSNGRVVTDVSQC